MDVVAAALGRPSGPAGCRYMRTLSLPYLLAFTWAACWPARHWPAGLPVHTLHTLQLLGAVAVGCRRLPNATPSPITVAACLLSACISECSARGAPRSVMR